MLQDDGVGAGSQIGGGLDWLVDENGDAHPCCISDNFKAYLEI